MKIWNLLVTDSFFTAGSIGSIENFFFSKVLFLGVCCGLFGKDTGKSSVIGKNLELTDLTL